MSPSATNTREQSADAASDFHTTDSSLLHRLFYTPRFQRLGEREFPLALVVVALLLTFLPLCITGLIELPWILKPTGGLKLPFLADWNLHFMFAISFPLLFVFTISDQRNLNEAVSRMLGDKALKITDANLKELFEECSSRFTRINRMAQVAGLIVGLAVAFGNYKAYSNPDLGIWIMKNRHFSITGGVYLYCIFLFYFTVSIYIIRTIAISLMFNGLLGRAHRMDVYFHADNCNGLSPIGTFAIRSQYLLTTFTINIIILYYVYQGFFAASPVVLSLVIASILACVIIGPVLFVVPLLPIHKAMLREKTKLLNEISEQLRIEFGKTYQKLRQDKVSREEGDAIEQLIKIRTIVDDMPDWPFDTHTFRKYLTAYMAPIAIPILQLIHGALK